MQIRNICLTIKIWSSRIQIKKSFRPHEPRGDFTYFHVYKYVVWHAFAITQNSVSTGSTVMGVAWEPSKAENWVVQLKRLPDKVKAESLVKYVTLS